MTRMEMVRTVEALVSAGRITPRESVYLIDSADKWHEEGVSYESNLSYDMEHMEQFRSNEK